MHVAERVFQANEIAGAKALWWEGACPSKHLLGDQWSAASRGIERKVLEIKVVRHWKFIIFGRYCKHRKKLLKTFRQSYLM